MRALLVIALLASSAWADGARDNSPPKGFASYPGSRELCRQHVTGDKMHIIWSSHASRDELAKVVAYYEKTLGKKAKAEANGAKAIHADANRHVTIYPVASEGKLPTCTKKSMAGEKTIVMLSHAIR